MELVKEAMQSLAETAASYRLGQAVLRQLDRALWVVEKCAKWAVPPPLDQEERPELVRPLPWVLFLAMLVVLRVTRETISLANLVLGKPPLRSADVVMYIRSKRRYLRTLKYTGSRVNRARSMPQTKQPWYRDIQSLFAFTMCFRRQPITYGNNNTRLSSNDEVLVVPGKQSGQASPPAEPSTMEKLIERIMVDLDAQSDDDSSFTLTNARSDQSIDSQSDHENCNGDGGSMNSTIASIGSSENSMSPIHNDVASSTPEKSTELNESVTQNVTNNGVKIQKEQTPVKPKDKSELSEPNHVVETNDTKNNSDGFEVLNSEPKIMLPKEESLKFIQAERSPPKIQKPKKLANGRSMSAPKKKKGLQTQRRPSDITDGKTADNSSV